MTTTTMPVGICCKYCDSTNTIRFGALKGVQRYYCKDCKRKFVPDTLPMMKTPAKIVASALGQYYGGMPLDSIQRQLQQDYGLSMSEVGIYKWISRFSEQAVKQAKAFKPKVGDVWIADETVLHVGGRQMWFWDIIDEKSRFLLATRLSNTRTIKDAEALMQQAYERAGKAPRKIVTDKLNVSLVEIPDIFRPAHSVEKAGMRQLRSLRDSTVRSRIGLTSCGDSRAS